MESNGVSLNNQKPDREVEKCELAEPRHAAREASPEAGAGHSLLLNGGLAGMEAQAGLARGCDGPKQGMVSYRHAQGKGKREKGTGNERQVGQAIGGINEQTSPAEQVRRMIAQCSCGEQAENAESGLGYAAVEGSVHPKIRDYAADTGDSLSAAVG